MRNKIYDSEYLENYNYLIQDYRAVFDNMLDSGISVPEKILKLENKCLIKQFKRDVKFVRKQAKYKIKEEIKLEKKENKILRKSKFNNLFKRLILAFKRPKKDKLLNNNDSLEKQK